MVMIVGLPGVGKTTWGLKMCADHPQKRYNIIGTDTLIDKMKVMGLPRKNNYSGRWDVLISKASACLNKLFNIGECHVNASSACRSFLTATRVPISIGILVRIEEFKLPVIIFYFQIVKDAVQAHSHFTYNVLL